MKLYFIFLLFFTSFTLAQVESEKWDAKVVDYRIPKEFENNTSSNSFISSLRYVYKLFISDLDGDNCPFYPSCSNYFVQAAEETNIFKATLMFADRFTRDMNIFKGENRYNILKNKKYFDPVDNYLLDVSKIKFR